MTGCKNQHIDRMLEMTSNAPTNSGKHVSQTKYVHIASDTQKIQSSD